MTSPKWFARQRFEPQFLRLIGIYVAACGFIERCITNGIVHMRNEGVARAAEPIQTAFSKRHGQWMKAAKEFVSDNPDDLKLVESLYDRTEKLMELRHILVHSFWFGQDADKALCLQQVQEKRGRLEMRSLEIEMPYLAARAQQLEPLVDDHMHFLNDRLIRERGGEHLYKQSGIGRRTTTVHPPTPPGWRDPPQNVQRLALKNK